MYVHRYDTCVVSVGFSAVVNLAPRFPASSGDQNDADFRLSEAAPIGTVVGVVDVVDDDEDDDIDVDIVEGNHEGKFRIENEYD